jgi:DNA-binding GntR family transcriptional regulator
VSVHAAEKRQSDRPPSARARHAPRAEELIWAQAMAARIACQQMTEPALNALRDSIDRACRLPSKPGWARKAAAHTETYRLLAGMTGEAAADERSSATWLIQDIIRTVGPAADGMITGSRQRLLAHFGAGDADGAALETEAHLRALHFMWRLGRQSASGEWP